jgi:hypothetical protein
MRAFDYHEAWEMKPRKLTLEEVENPEQVIEELFQYASLPELRWHLWEGTKTLVAGGFNTLKVRERHSLLYFFEQIEKLIEVTHVMYEKRKLSSLS